MALKDKKVSDSLLQTGVVSAPDKLTGTAAENKMVFDRLIRNIVAQSVNPLIDELTGENGAASIGFPGGNLGAFSAQALAHIADKKNPHGVAVSQIGAETPEGHSRKSMLPCLPIRRIKTTLMALPRPKSVQKPRKRHNKK